MRVIKHKDFRQPTREKVHDVGGVAKTCSFNSFAATGRSQKKRCFAATLLFRIALVTKGSLSALESAPHGVLLYVPLVSAKTLVETLINVIATRCPCN